MIVDASAILAILLQEVDARQYAEAIYVADACRMSAANFLEAAINLDSRLGPAAGRQLDTFVERSLIAIEPVTVEQARIARQAYLDYGKGYHPAGLNFGDVFAYALSKTTRQPLLFKGNDFSQTDIEVVPLGPVNAPPAEREASGSPLEGGDDDYPNYLNPKSEARNKFE